MFRMVVANHPVWDKMTLMGCISEEEESNIQEMNHSVIHQQRHHDVFLPHFGFFPSSLLITEL